MDIQERQLLAYIVATGMRPFFDSALIEQSLRDARGAWCQLSWTSDYQQAINAFKTLTEEGFLQIVPGRDLHKIQHTDRGELYAHNDVFYKMCIQEMNTNNEEDEEDEEDEDE
jgi:hypothetical protein